MNQHRNVLQGIPPLGPQKPIWPKNLLLSMKQTKKNSKDSTIMAIASPWDDTHTPIGYTHKEKWKGLPTYGHIFPLVQNVHVHQWLKHRKMQGTLTPPTFINDSNKEPKMKGITTWGRSCLLVWHTQTHVNKGLINKENCNGFLHKSSCTFKQHIHVNHHQE